MVLFGALIYLPFLDLRPFRFEEGRRALQAIEMLQGDAWWSLTVLGESYINKPPFTPWLISAAALLHGALDEIAVRLPGVVFALVGGLAAGTAAWLVTTADRRVAGLVGGLAFICSINLLLKTRVGETDVTVTAICGLAFAIWLAGRLRQGRPGGLHWAAIALCFACAAMTKGPIPILFPAIAMVVVPLLQRRFGEAAVAVGVVAAAHLPLAFWVWSNLAPGNAEHWAVELRLAKDQSPGPGLGKMLLLNDLPLALLYQMPFLPAAIAMIFERRALPADRRWIVDALLLYAVPMTILTTVLPMGKSRYAMPAEWPMAVLAGMWISLKWRQLHVAQFIVVAGVLLAIGVQIVQIGFLDGRTEGQRSLRARAEQFSATLAGLPPGPLALLWTGPSFDYNLLAYAGRRLFLLQPGNIGCPNDSDYLVAGRADRHTVEASHAWTERDQLSDWGLLYQRAENAPAADCTATLGALTGVPSSLAGAADQGMVHRGDAGRGLGLVTLLR